MKNLSLLFVVSLALSTVAWSQTETCEKNLPQDLIDMAKRTNGPGNYMLCNVSVLKEGKVVSQHLVTTYDASLLINPKFIHHEPVTSVSRCVSQAFGHKFNRENLYSEGGKYIDLCYKMNNGVNEGEDGYAEFYLAKRSTNPADYYRSEYLNEGSPVILRGDEEASGDLGKFEISAKCRNEILYKDDPFWAEIRKTQIGY